jgi:hypothetical protein
VKQGKREVVFKFQRKVKVAESYFLEATENYICGAKSY